MPIYSPSVTVFKSTVLMSKVRGRSNKATTMKDANKVMTTAIEIFRACLFFIFSPPLPKT